MPAVSDRPSLSHTNRCGRPRWITAHPTRGSHRLPDAPSALVRLIASVLATTLAQMTVPVRVLTALDADSASQRHCGHSAHSVTASRRFRLAASSGLVHEGPVPTCSRLQLGLPKCATCVVIASTISDDPALPPAVPVRNAVRLHRLHHVPPKPPEASLSAAAASHCDSISACFAAGARSRSRSR